jgi:EthD domain
LRTVGGSDADKKARLFMTIRLVHLLRRAPGLTLDAFHERWLDGHGPLVASHQSRLRILRYTQSHRLVEPADAPTPRGTMEAPYDGVAEFWWESEESYGDAMSTEAGRRAGAELLEEEAAFIDLENSPLWFAHEFPQMSTSLTHVVARPRSGIVKIHYAIRPLPHLGMAEAQHYWLHRHGDLARSYNLLGGGLCYQQVHRYESPLEDHLRQQRGTVGEPYIGHAEAWYDRLQSQRGPEISEFRRTALEDEGRFIDFSRSARSMSKEYVLIDRW